MKAEGVDGGAVHNPKPPARSRKHESHRSAASPAAVSSSGMILAAASVLFSQLWGSRHARGARTIPLTPPAAVPSPLSAVDVPSPHEFSKAKASKWHNVSPRPAHYLPPYFHSTVRLHRSISQQFFSTHDLYQSINHAHEHHHTTGQRSRERMVPQSHKRRLSSRRRKHDLAAPLTPIRTTARGLSHSQPCVE